MDIQTKHRVTLLNAKCNYVCAVDTLVHKMNYGEDADCCVNKLYLAQRLIGRLECFCFDGPTSETEVLTEFTYELPNNNYQEGDILQLIVDGVQVAYRVAGVESKVDFWIALLAELNIETTTTNLGAVTHFVSTFPCNVIEIIILTTREGSTTVSTPGKTADGVCSVSTPPCYNCIEVSDLPKMYEVLGKLLQ